MKTIRNLILTSALLVSASTLRSGAATFFADYFTNSSTLNTAPTAPTVNSTSYETAIGLTNGSSTPSLVAGKLNIVFPNTSSTVGEAVARFTNSIATLSQVGDYLEAKVVFVNLSNILSGTATANSTINIGMFNSGGANPVQGQFALNANNITGGQQSWIGYASRIGLTANAQIFTRSAQTANGLTSQHEDLLFNGASSSQTYTNPAGTLLGSTSSAVTISQGSTNVLYLKISLDAVGSLTISNALFPGASIISAPTLGQQQIATNATLITSGFDALAFGWRNSSSPGQASAMSVLSIEVTGQSTAVSGPPNIITQPIAATVPSGAACAFYVVAQGFNMTYQWHRYGTNLANGGNVSGATSDTLVISPASAADVASTANGYYVTVTGTGNYSTNSDKVSLSLGTAKNLVWSGSGNVWDLNTSQNWLNNGNPDYFNFGDTVTMDDTASGGFRLITLTGKYLSASSVTVDSPAGNAYSFVAASTGSFAGPGKLIFRGTGQLTIGNANTYSGGTIISNSSQKLILQNYAGLGTGPVTFAKAGAQLQLTQSGSAAVGVNGDVIVNEDCSIQTDGTGAFAAVFLGNLSGTAGKTLTFNPTDLTTTNRYRVYGANTVMDANVVLNGPAVSPAQYAGTVLALYNDTGLQLYNGTISGNGGIISRGNGTFVVAGQNSYVGGTTPTSGSLGVGADSTPTSGTVVTGPFGAGPLYLAPEAPNLAGNGTVIAWDGARTIANPIQYPSGTNNQGLTVAGTNALTFNGAVTLQGNDGGGTNRFFTINNTALTTFGGAVSDGGGGYGIVKLGTGVLALTANNTYTGPTLVSNGTLRVNGSLAVASAVTVSTNGVLGGTGTVNGPVTVLQNGAVSPGSSIGTLTINNNLLLSGNLNIEVNRSGSASDRMNVSGILTNAGTGTVTVTNLGAALQPGDTFTLFNKPLTNGSALTITGGLVNWTNKLAVDGTISVLASIPTTPTNLIFSLSGSALTLSWPPNYTGWSLQSNIVSVAATNSWFIVPNSTTVTQVVVTVSPARSNVFYRMYYPTNGF